MQIANVEFLAAMHENAILPPGMLCRVGGETMTEIKTNPGFFAVIPAPVLNDCELNPGAKLLFATLSQLLNEEGYTVVSNAYLSARHHIARRTVQEWLDALKKRQHIVIEVNRDAAKIRDHQRRIFIREGGMQKSAYRYAEKFIPGYAENCTHKSIVFKNNPLIPTGESVQKESCFSFSDFWEAYGKKTGRKKAEQRYAKVKEADRALIRENLPAYIAATPNITYRKNPLTWLNGECWNDELPKHESKVNPNRPAMLSIEDLRNREGNLL